MKFMFKIHIGPFRKLFKNKWTNPTNYIWWDFLLSNLILLASPERWWFKQSKREILNLIKQYNINEASKKECLDGSIEVNIKFGNQTMNKQPTIRELILNISSEVKQINGRLDKIEVRLDKLENCPTIKKELGL